MSKCTKCGLEMKCKIVYKGKNPYSPFNTLCYHCETHNVNWESSIRRKDKECWIAKHEKDKEATK